MAAALTPCSVVVLSHDPIHPFSWTLLNQKTIKETQLFLDWNEQMSDLPIISLEQGEANRKFSVVAGIAFTVKYNHHHVFLFLQEYGKSAMEYQEEVP